MPVVECPTCGSEDLQGIKLDNDQIEITCHDCGELWRRGEAKRVYRTMRTYEDLRAHFPSTGDVTDAARERADGLKDEFLRDHPAARPEVAVYWDKYQGLFSAEGLQSAPAQDLKDFANSNVGANPGNMSVFNTEWNTLGSNVAAPIVRDAISYLHYGTRQPYIEDRLTTLMQAGEGMKGFKEALLTKVLCIVEPARFVPIVKYTGTAGKKQIAEAVYGLRLPGPDTVSSTLGRLIFWSNDLLRDLAGAGFVNMAHVSAFLWWAKDQTDTAGSAGR